MLIRRLVCLLCLSLLIAPTWAAADKGYRPPPPDEAPILNWPQLREQRTVGLVVAGLGWAAGLSLASWGSWQILQDVNQPFNSAVMQRDVFTVGGGLLVAGLFSIVWQALTSSE